MFKTEHIAPLKWDKTWHLLTTMKAMPHYSHLFVMLSISVTQQNDEQRKKLYVLWNANENLSLQEQHATENA